MASHINDLQTAVASLEAKLGIDGSAVNTSHDYKLSTIRTGEKVLAVGDVKMILGATAPTGWLLMKGLTIGDGTSGATARANADQADLFAYIWDNIANTEAPIYDSAGAASTRGASAAADFAAHKRLLIPDASGRIPVMYKSADGDFGTLGKAAGAKTYDVSHLHTTGNHTLTESEIPAHTHTIGHVAGDQDGSGSNGSISGSGTTGSTGGGAAHNHGNTGTSGSATQSVLNPSITLNFCIKY